MPATTVAHPSPERQSGSRPVRAVEDISLRSFPSWIRRTIVQDRQFRARTPAGARPWTVTRVLSTLYPRLHRPVFIVGAPRSGTTFLGECVASLPEISYHFEPVVTKAAARYVFERRWGLAKSRFVFRSVYRLLLRMYGDGDLRFSEKTPQNCFVIAFLARAFPDASFVHIVRDGRDAALSYSKKPWLLARSAARGAREAGGYLNGPHARFWVEPDRRAEFEATTDFHRCIWAWRLHTESALRQIAELPSARHHELRYEDLVRQPAREASRLMRFLGISDRESIERFESVLQRASDASVGAWTRELTAEQLREADAEAGHLLRRLGYVATAPA